MKNKDLVKIFSVIFVDIAAFGMVIPLTPILARNVGEGGLKIGLLISCYSIVQFLLAPFWGRLSDSFGRKPILLLGFCGSCMAHLFFAFSDSFQDIFLSRILAGFFGGNVLIASAYIADITSEENRSKNLGLIGMAFGAGFTIGPIVGFLFILLGSKIGSIPPFGANFASAGASLFCLMNFIFSYFFLKESMPFKRKLFEEGFFKASSFFKRPSLRVLWKAFISPQLGIVLLMFFILWFSLAHIEPVLILLVQDDFFWDKKTAYASFIYIGLLMVLSQGWLVRWWIPKWGEAFVNQLGLAVMGLGLLLIPLASLIAPEKLDFLSPSFFVLFAGVTAFSIGYSISNTSLNGAISLLSPKKSQGSVFGVNQSLSSMARILGPVSGGWLYQKINHESPFAFAGFLCFFAFIVAFISKKSFPNKGKAIKNNSK